MTKWIFLVSTLAAVHCRPQINNVQAPASVEIEKQHVVEIHPEGRQLFQETKTANLSEKQLDEHTKQILEKIALVNEQQGLNKKKPKPQQHSFPFSYLRSQDSSRQNTDFKFPRDPFSNPILDYVERNNFAAVPNKAPATSYTVQDTTNDDDIPPGHYIKRKITHQQTMIIPGTAYLPPNLIPPPAYMQQLYGMNPVPEATKKPENSEVNKDDLEKQTVDTIKNIVESSQYPTNPQQPLLSPYAYPQAMPMQNLYQLYGPYFSQQIYRPGKQWSPLAQYFPIVIKDPFVQMFNALTSMVEYGPQANAQDACRKAEEKKEEGNEKTVTPSRAKQISEEKKLTYSVVDNGDGAEVTVVNNDDSNLTTVIDIEDLQISDKTEDPLTLKLNLRQSKQIEETVKKVEYNPSTDSVQITKSQVKTDTTSRQSPPVRDQELYDDELASEESEKAQEALISHQGPKKVVTKDNTGSGIFVHRIKVRKGGVAIAGPGGIATAGSGGTAIVGPNGYAYTHPDSLAIAGSGTKVVAVEPTINLSQVVMDHTKNNRTRGEGHLPSRIGKVVAVGPVIYYNKG